MLHLRTITSIFFMLSLYAFASTPDRITPFIPDSAQATAEQAAAFDNLLKKFETLPTPKFDRASKAEGVGLKALDLIVGVDAYALTLLDAKPEQMEQGLLKLITLSNWLKNSGSLYTDLLNLKVQRTVLQLIKHQLCFNGPLSDSDKFLKFLNQPTLDFEYIKQLSEEKYSFKYSPKRIPKTRTFEYNALADQMFQSHTIEKPISIFSLHLSELINDCHPVSLLVEASRLETERHFIKAHLLVSQAVQIPLISINAALYKKAYNDLNKEKQLDYYDEGHSSWISADRYFSGINYWQSKIGSSEFPKPTPHPPLIPEPTPTPKQKQAN